MLTSAWLTLACSSLAAAGEDFERGTVVTCFFGSIQAEKHFGDVLGYGGLNDVAET